MLAKLVIFREMYILGLKFDETVVGYILLMGVLLERIMKMVCDTFLEVV